MLEYGSATNGTRLSAAKIRKCRRMPTAKSKWLISERSWPAVYSPFNTVARWAWAIRDTTAWQCWVSFWRGSIGTNTRSASSRSTM